MNYFKAYAPGASELPFNNVEELLSHPLISRYKEIRLCEDRLCPSRRFPFYRFSVGRSDQSNPSSFIALMAEYGDNKREDNLFIARLRLEEPLIGITVYE